MTGLPVPGYADIRWKQTAKYGFLPNHLMPSTFLAVTIDLPETNSNHTRLAKTLLSRNLNYLNILKICLKNLLFLGIQLCMGDGAQVPSVFMQTDKYILSNTLNSLLLNAVI